MVTIALVAALAALATAAGEAPCLGGGRIVSNVSRPFTGAAPKAMPEDLVDAYTRCGAIEMHDVYVDETRGGQGSHIKYSGEDITTMLAGSRKLKNMPPRQQLRAAGTPLTMWVNALLSKHPELVQGMHVVVFGSTSPAYETMVLAHGAASVTTVEYNKLSYAHAALSTWTVADAQAQLKVDATGAPGRRLLAGRFGLALSISSFDHDGLGRYGDPLAPDGDLLASDGVAAYLAPGGSYLLAVPVGPDAVAWNLHRRYGALRLPLLLSGWQLQDVAGWEPSRLHAAQPVTRSYEPVWLLRSSGAAQPLSLPGVLDGSVTPPSAPQRVPRRRRSGSEEL